MRKWKRSSVIKVIAAVILVITAVCVCLHISGIVESYHYDMKVKSSNASGNMNDSSQGDNYAYINSTMLTSRIMIESLSKGKTDMILESSAFGRYSAPFIVDKYLYYTYYKPAFDENTAGDYYRVSLSKGKKSPEKLFENTDQPDMIACSKSKLYYFYGGMKYGKIYERDLKSGKVIMLKKVRCEGSSPTLFSLQDKTLYSYEEYTGELTSINVETGISRAYNISTDPDDYVLDMDIYKNNRLLLAMSKSGILIYDTGEKKIIRKYQVDLGEPFSISPSTYKMEYRSDKLYYYDDKYDLWQCDIGTGATSKLIDIGEYTSWAIDTVSYTYCDNYIVANIGYTNPLKKNDIRIFDYSGNNAN